MEGRSASIAILRYFGLSNFFLTAVSLLLDAVMHSLATKSARVSQISRSFFFSKPVYSNKISGWKFTDDSKVMSEIVQVTKHD